MAIVLDLFFQKKSQLAKDSLQLAVHFILPKPKGSSSKKWILAKRGATSYFSWDGNWLWPTNNILVLKLTRFWKDSPTKKEQQHLRCFSKVVPTLFVSHYLNISSNHRTGDRTNGGETLNSGARTKGVLEPRLSGLGLRESFWFLGTVFNMRWRPTKIHTQNIMNYYPSVSQRSKAETRQYVIICGSFFILNVGNSHCHVSLQKRQTILCLFLMSELHE